MDDPEDPFVERAATWAAGLRPRDLPPPVRRAAGADRLAAVGAAAWTLALSEGDRCLATATRMGGTRDVDASGERDVRGADSPGATLLGHGPTDPATAAAGNAALAATSGFDDRVFGADVGYAPVFVPIAYAESGVESRGRRWTRAVLAAVAANEVAGRVASAASLGGPTPERAAHVHALAACVARGVVGAVDPGTLADAMALSLAEPPWPLEAASLGADTTPVATLSAVRAGIECVDAARDGVAGPHDVVEADDGFLAAFSSHPIPEYLDGLGERFHTRAVSATPYPVAGHVSAAVEAALDARRRLGPGVAEVSHVDVEASAFTRSRDARAEAYLRGPDTPLPALGSTVGYNVAAALLDGEHTPRQRRPRRRGARDGWELASRVRLEVDSGLTKAALRSPLPPGGPIRRTGVRALPTAIGEIGAVPALKTLPTLLGAVRPGPLPEEFAALPGTLGARVTVTLSTGRRVTADRPVPSGSAGRPLADVRASARGRCEAALFELAGEDAPARRRVDELREPEGDVSLARIGRLCRRETSVAALD